MNNTNFTDKEIYCMAMNLKAGMARGILQECSYCKYLPTCKDFETLDDLRMKLMDSTGVYLGYSKKHLERG